MTLFDSEPFASIRVDDVSSFPDVECVIAPTSAAIAATACRAASEAGARIRFWGGGTHQGYGYPTATDLILSTERLQSIVTWSPDDLTVVVEAGVSVARLEDELATRGQTAVLPEQPGAATVGGVVAAGQSGWRRARYGPTRDRILETTVVTGDGRVVRSGARVVKNVTGYDIPRLMTGSFGSLGLITSICLKLWPIGAAQATVSVDDPAEAAERSYRPLAVVESEGRSTMYLAGTQDEVTGQAAEVGGDPLPGLDWPAPLGEEWRFTVQVPPAHTRHAVSRVRAIPGTRFRAAHGVGHVAIGADSPDLAAVVDLRSWAESLGGALIVAASPPSQHEIDPWGTPPQGLSLQRSVKAAFDPAGIANPGLLPGRL